MLANMKKQAPLVVVAVIPSNTVAGRAELRGVSDTARRLGWILETIDPALVGEDFSSSLPLLSRANGVIVRLYENLADGTLGSLGIPLVAIDEGPSKERPHSFDAWAHILSDQYAIGEAAAVELLATNRRVFAFVPMLRRYPWAGKRGEAFLKGIHAADCDGHLYKPVTEYDWIGERNSLAEWLGTLPRPFGVFAANDLLAKLVYEACRTAGLSIPSDVAVVGADDDETLCLSVDPPLTSIRIDFEGAGHKAAEKLAVLMASGARPGRRTIVRYGVMGVARRASTRTDATPGFDHRLVSGLDFIAMHYRNPFIGAHDVAVAMGIGRRQADRIFTATGKTIRAHIETMRLEAARKMLETSEDSITEIASHCGFASANYFIRLYRAKLGVTPGQAKKSASSRK